MCCNGDKGIPGLSGPASTTYFEIKDGCWRKEHVELQNLCFKIISFINAHPDIASKVEVTKYTMKSTL